ncbi:c-type cytochrome [Methylobacterium durans]|uniref:Cytochrome C552 n=1 Tax=Methylobacterium durans TaxID=2202825 RepID=A0A2U8WBX7_9HYPH|nr:cytochrome c [Methylobacterium durans]AWN42802.1 cytochrome C552 [Methylobacterium durans]
MSRTRVHVLRALTIGCLLAASIARPAADPAEDHRVRGWTIATQLCIQCHVIGRGPQAGEFVGPAFLRVANMPSTTGMSLNVFLQSHHQRMPSLRLDRDEMDAVIAYILSLKGTGPARP